jgi:hypothetical protein
MKLPQPESQHSCIRIPSNTVRRENWTGSTIEILAAISNRTGRHAPRSWLIDVVATKLKKLSTVCTKAKATIDRHKESRQVYNVVSVSILQDERLSMV